MNNLPPMELWFITTVKPFHRNGPSIGLSGVGFREGLPQRDFC